MGGLRAQFGDRAGQRLEVIGDMHAQRGQGSRRRLLRVLAPTRGHVLGEVVVRPVALDMDQRAEIAALEMGLHRL